MLFGKTLLITGIGSGIGAQTALVAASLGAEIVGVDVKAPPANVPGAFIEADLSDPGAGAAIASRLPARLDALCNVAGISGVAGAAKTLAVNFYGLRALSEALAPRIREGGAIVNVASIAGYGWRANLERTKHLVGVQGFPDTAALVREFALTEQDGYPVSKEALLLWTQRAAHQPLFRDRAIRVNAVSPGPVTTPIYGEFRSLFGDARVDDDIARVGRPGTAPDIAPAIAFLCSDGARWINGANVPVDGGLEASVNASVLGF